MRQPHRLHPDADPLALDDASVERLLTGTLSAADAPPGYAGVAELLAATVAPPTARELAGQAAVLAELRAVTRARRAAVPARRPRRRRAGLAVVLVAGALATGGAAAAATGHLPEPVRRVLATVGGPATPTPPEPVPVTGLAGSGGAGPPGWPPTSAAGHPAGAGAGSAAGANLEGLCQAYLSGNGGEQGGKLDATAFQVLSRAAGGTDKTLAFCQRLEAAGAKGQPSEDAKPQDPPGGGNPGQGGPPATTGGGNGQGGGHGSPPTPTSPPPTSPHGNDPTDLPR
jgi:hypothetical protein